MEGKDSPKVPFLSPTNRIRRIVVLFLIINLMVFYYFFIHLSLNKILWNTFSSSTLLNLIDYSKFNQSQASSLDSECQFDRNDFSAQERNKEFNDVFENGPWGTSGSRSGSGSSIEGAYDWIRHLRALFEHYPIRSIADIPCGDTYWQFSLREMNTIEELYFGGDISTSVINQNQRLYGKRHQNKLFQYWDLVKCPIPTYTWRNSTHEIKGKKFDLIIVRDALQHMHIKNALKAVRNVILSGATFFALSTYPPNDKSSALNTRSLEKNESIPLMPEDCEKKNYCKLGAIKDGGYYYNNINCHPFNFPLNKAILVQPSHEKFPVEHDQIHIYKIDEELRQIVGQYDKACLEGI